MDHPKPELKYVSAKEVSGTAASLDGANVKSANGDTLGTIEGFIFDVRHGRPRHVVVAAGWFIHKHFLLPIGHVTLSPDRSALIADISKERIESFPGFDKSEFEKLDASQLGQLDHRIANVCTGKDVTGLETHYRVPEGWESAPLRN
jgi:uncharacterized protein YrrD